MRNGFTLCFMVIVLIMAIVAIGMATCDDETGSGEVSEEELEAAVKEAKNEAEQRCKQLINAKDQTETCPEGCSQKIEGALRSISELSNNQKEIVEILENPAMLEVILSGTETKESVVEIIKETIIPLLPPGTEPFEVEVKAPFKCICQRCTQYSCDKTVTDGTLALVLRIDGKNVEIVNVETDCVPCTERCRECSCGCLPCGGAPVPPDDNGPGPDPDPW